MDASPWEHQPCLSHLTEVKRAIILFMTVKSQQYTPYLEYMKLTCYPKRETKRPLS